MAGIAIIVKDMSFADDNVGQVAIITDPVPVTGISINGSANVPINIKTLTLSVSYTPSDTTERGISWTVVSGGTYASINQNGVVTLSNLVLNAKFKIRATSTDKPNVYGEKEFTVEASNILPEIKNGKKINISTGQFVDDSDYICTDWIDVKDMSIVSLVLTSTVPESGQKDGALSANNCMLGLYWEDMNGVVRDKPLGNLLISNATYGNATEPLNIPVRLMKRMALYSLVASPSGSAVSRAILRCNLSDWQSAKLMVKALILDSTETYNSDILHNRAYCALARQSMDAFFTRSSNTTYTQWMLQVKQGESVSLKAIGGNAGRAWIKFTALGTLIESSDANADYRTNAYTFTADRDMFLGGTEQNADLANFEVIITKPQ